MFEKFKEKYPFLYACKTCGKKVKVKIVKDAEPIIKRSCECALDTLITANRKVALVGIAELNKTQTVKKFIKQKFINFLCWLTGRSI